jgi:hypothetical protein
MKTNLTPPACPVLLPLDVAKGRQDTREVLGVGRPANERTIHPREREIVALTYFLAIFPFFGILVAAVVALTYHERSRTVVFHAKQAIVGQALLLLVFVVICLAGLFAMLVGVLSPPLKEMFIRLDKVVL